MGQIYSFLGYANTAKETNLNTILNENFSCKICLEILNDPVQCQNNEHYFCRECIVKRLENSQTCPLCTDQLTLESLHPAPRIVARLLCEMKKLHCSYIAQSCKDNAAMNGKQIFIIGGVDDSKSIEVFDWSTKTWTLMENVLFFSSVRSSSFLYGKRIMVCGGDSSKRIEFLDPTENGFTSTALPGSLPSTNLNGVLVENRIITFGCDVHETSLQRPWTSTVLIKRYRYISNNRCSCALERIGSDIFVIRYCGDRVERYDTAKKQLRTLTSLPYRVSNMATVTYKDNIIILGGKSYVVHNTSEFHPLNDVVMFNIYSLECKRLPSMLQKRSGCAAVNMGDVVVVMGGETKDAEGQTQSLKTAEYFVIGESKWQELPAMNQARVYPTACVYP